MNELIDVTTEQLETILGLSFKLVGEDVLFNLSSNINKEIGSNKYDEEHSVNACFTNGKKSLKIYIDNPNNLSVKNSLNKIKLTNENLKHEDTLIPSLVLEVIINNDRNNLISFCPIIREFIKLGKNYEYWNELVHSPNEWLENIAKNIGNRYIEKHPYALFGELVVLKQSYEEGFDPKWNEGQSIYESGSNDILCTNGLNFEVKTTKTRYLNEVVIHSQYQLKVDYKDNLYLAFVRVEKDINGVSINDLLAYFDEKHILAIGDQSIHEIIENQELNSKQLSEKYNVLETCFYKIDNDFPSITKNSFKGDELPLGVTKIEYTVNLSGLKKYSLTEIRGLEQ